MEIIEIMLSFFITKLVQFHYVCFYTKLIPFFKICIHFLQH